MGKFICHHVPETSWLYTVGIPKPITVDNFIQIVDVHYTTYKQCFGNGLSLSDGFFLFLYRGGHLCEYFKNINSCIFRDTLDDGWGDGVILYTSVKGAKSVMSTYSESPRWALVFFPVLTLCVFWVSTDFTFDISKLYLPPLFQLLLEQLGQDHTGRQIFSPTGGCCVAAWTIYWSGAHFCLIYCTFSLHILERNYLGISETISFYEDQASCTVWSRDLVEKVQSNLLFAEVLQTMVAHTALSQTRNLQL